MNRKLRVLIACETSGASRRAWEKLGHEVMSCDLLPADDGATNHYQGSVLDILYDDWDMMLAHPPCTYLTSSGLHWNNRIPGRAEKTEQALDFVQQLMEAPIKHIAIENPMGCIGTRLRKANQYVQPYEFGHDASKKTGLWLKGLPVLTKDQSLRVPGRIVTLANGKTVERWANQTDSGQNRLPPSEDRWKIRSETYQGIADAMAEQWSDYILNVSRKEAA